MIRRLLGPALSGLSVRTFRVIIEGMPGQAHVAGDYQLSLETNLRHKGCTQSSDPGK
jgi:hypothetical protein